MVRLCLEVCSLHGSSGDVPQVADKDSVLTIPSHPSVALLHLASACAHVSAEEELMFY